MLALALALMWLVIAIAPDTPIGRTVRRGLVEAPATFFNRVRRGHVLLVLILIAACSALLWLIGEESVRLLGMGAPELASWLALVDAATILDVAASALLVAASVRRDAVRDRLDGAWRRVARRPRSLRSPRASRVRTERPADNDDEEPRPARAA